MNTKRPKGAGAGKVNRKDDKSVNKKRDPLDIVLDAILELGEKLQELREKRKEENAENENAHEDGRSQ